MIILFRNYFFCFLTIIVAITSNYFTNANIENVVSVVIEDGNYRLYKGIVPNWVAKANFTDTTLVDGWSYVEVESSEDYQDNVQAYAAGYAEGASSQSVIYNHWRNMQENYCSRKGVKLCQDVYKFLRQNIIWMKSMIKKHQYVNPLWHQVDLVLAQLVGIYDGYNDWGDKPISLQDIFFLNMFGDLFDLEAALNTTNHNMTAEEWVNSPRFSVGDGHCSAIIKVLPGNTDLLSAHVSWFYLNSMLRTQKRYTLPFHFFAKPQHTTTTRPVVPGHVTTFSSYPGLLHSGDDYYIMSSGLISIETSIGNSNPQLWSNVKPEGELLEFIRVVVANRLAKSGKVWVDVFSQYNSGTYNNQWMVVDYKRFKPGKAIKKDTLWVLEQMPGKIVSADQSGVLRNRTYWSSYNIPYYEEIFNMSGAPLMVEKYGDWFSYDHAPRANIFRRDHTKVKDLQSLERLMRYNDYKNDPLSACDCIPPYSAENAISARGDLNPINGTYPFPSLGHRNHVGTDLKMTNRKLLLKMKFQAAVGPTNDQQPTFIWSQSDFKDTVPHYGQPDVWNFTVVEHKWIW